jgi:serine phosphatase RsbU (regulator of sigma subunit)
MAIAFIVLSLLAIYKKRVDSLKKRQKELEETVKKRTEEVVQQKEIVEAMHHEVSQSIDYATRLQRSILPKEDALAKYISDFFVLFKPKDKVSGDFYWWAHVEDHTIITAADCTGHGVPGAFMSMMGTSFLREIVQKEYITHTGVILRKLRREVIKALNQKGESGEQKDGMDMAIISIDHQTNTVLFSGAQNPLYIITNNKRKLEGYNSLEDFDGFYELKGDKMPIAIYDRMEKFTTYELQLQKGDQLYMFSDGFVDQFGGPKGKKFKSKPFKKLIYEISSKPMKEQRELLNTAYENWKGKLEQIDDVVVLGVKI